MIEMNTGVEKRMGKNLRLGEMDLAIHMARADYGILPGLDGDS
jgi:hypothetical protein